MFFRRLASSCDDRRRVRDGGLADHRIAGSGSRRSAVGIDPSIVSGAKGADGDRVVRRRRRRRRRPGRPAPFPPLVDFPVVPARDAAPEVRDEDYVVGVELDGEARAYPLNMLSRPSATSSTIPWAAGRSP